MSTRVRLFRDAGEPSSIGIMTDALVERLRQDERFVIGESHCRPPGRDSSWGSLSRRAGRFGLYPLKALGARRQADVFHVLSQSDAHLAYFLPPRRTVITCHDLIFMLNVAGSGRLERAVLRLGARALSRVGAVVCPSVATRNEILRLLPAASEHVHVIPNGVDGAFHPLEGSRTISGLPFGRRVLLHVSTGTPRKNAPATLRALDALLRKGHDVCLVRVGSLLSPREAELARTLGVSNRVVELGVVPRDRLVELYNAAAMLIFPSFVEGFGLPVLEAMACGTPVVASDCAALHELAGGAIAEAGATDIAALTGAAERILTDPARADHLRRAGLQRATMFSWDATAARYAQVYEAVAASCPHT